MPSIKEAQMRELVEQLGLKEREEVVAEVIKEWDREGRGCYAGFIIENFGKFWLERVRRN